jgi:hypothetical protein
MVAKPYQLLFSALALMTASAFIAASIWAGETEMRPLRTQMSQDELIALALSAAPAHIAKDAAVMLPGEDGKLVEARQGTNGFTCVPDPNPDAERLEPVCMDQATFQWFTSFKSNALKPTNTVPGIAYMAKGAQGWVKDGKLLPKKEPGAILVDFPPHWMIFWPFDSKTSGFPSCTIEPEKMVRPGNACILWEGSPYASLTIFQNPAKLKM